MRVFVAGATGVIGRPLTKQLREAGHEVIGTTRSSERAEMLRELGASRWSWTPGTPPPFAAR